MAALAPTVLPGLQRSLEVAFLAGLATSRRLSGSQASPLSSSRMPVLPQRFKLSPREAAKVYAASCPSRYTSLHLSQQGTACPDNLLMLMLHGSRGMHACMHAHLEFGSGFFESAPCMHAQGAAVDERPKAPPNDPERQGNIWHRYEQMQSAARKLEGEKRALAADKTRSQQEKWRLEDALLEVSEGLSSSGGGGAHAAVSPDTAQLLAEIRGKPRLPRSPQRPERAPAQSAAGPTVCVHDITVNRHADLQCFCMGTKWQLHAQTGQRW